ncbi:MAG: hypothetical protein HN742_05745 [Lentisphaerae bacterium]|nr:hypothetical protein [Lentisphaerota bacterium]MBT5607407.1 hypothetical protein [Lentisphaerota bacterium]MBT7056115.1 hypothetical protein [Lentisphaerota bacterium]MBT7841353.1 hypothetical protein [Lentisphaerota bacterium]
MTRKERLHRCYFNQEIDRPAVYSRTGFPADDPTYDRLRSLFRERTELKGGWRGFRFSAAGSSSRAVEPHSEDFERHTTTLHTPAGDLRASHMVSLKGLPGLQETYYITCRQDAETYLSLPIPEVLGDDGRFAETCARIGDAGIVEVSLGANPGGTVAQLCGSETFAIMSITDRDILHELCERWTEAILRTVRHAAERGYGPYFCMAGEEYILPPLHGRQDFIDFNAQYDRRIIDLIHDIGGRIHIHSHGSISSVLQDFVDMGTDVLHPFEPPPLGDITAADAKAVCRGKVCLEGNIQIHHMYEHTPAQVRAETEALIADVFDDQGGLIVCPSASPFIRGEGATCYPQYAAMVDAVLSR